MSGKLNIKQQSPQDRPREKFMNNGAENLSPAELLAILIGSGSTEETSVQLMQRILNDCDNKLNYLGKRSMEELMQYNGIGEAKAITILAACELARRRQQEKTEERRFNNAADIYRFMRDIVDENVEEAWVVLLNQNYRLLKKVRLSRGGITETAVDIRIIIKEALLVNATVIALCHNHPSGNTRPSRDDNMLTQRVKAACATMRIHLLDHVIVTTDGYYSYCENGKL